MFLFGISLFCLALSPWFWLSWVILLFLGLSDIFPMGTTVLQLSVPPELRGRVMSLWIMTVALSMIGSFPMALAADYTNWPTAFASGAAICLIAGLILGVLRPTLRRLAL
jgi:predicted MFS family arabinose efflux permease